MRKNVPRRRAREHTKTNINDEQLEAHVNRTDFEFVDKTTVKETCRTTGDRFLSCSRRRRTSGDRV